MRKSKLFNALGSGVSLAIMVGLGTFARPQMAAASETKPVSNDSPDKVGDDDVDIVIRGLPTKGKVVLPASETEFKFKLHDTGTIMTFRWSSLDEYERKRVQKLYGMEVANDGSIVFGEKMTGVKYKLSSGKFIEGFREPDRDRPGLLCLRTASAIQWIPKSDVVSEEAFERYESEFFSAQEVYDRRMLEKAPSDAAEHLKMARWTASIGLYGKAIEHLEQAKILDPRTEERNQDFRAELYQKHADQQANTIFDMMLRERRGGDNLSALDHLDQLDRSFKNSNLKSRWDALRSQIEADAKLEVNKKIVVMSYRVADDLLKKKFFTKLRIDDKGNIIPSIPGKLVTTKQGQSFKGQLVGVGGNAMTGSAMEPDEYEKKEGIAPTKPSAPAAPKGAGADDIVLKMGDTTITIAGKDVLSMIDVDLSVAKQYADMTYDELKEYVTGADGLKNDMCRYISKIVKMPSTDVAKIFDGRLSKEARYEEGRLSMTNNYASFHDADYGIASWFRPGAQKPMKFIKANNNANPNGSSNSRYGNNNRGGRGNQNQQQTAAQQEETAEETDDPGVWWKTQKDEVKIKFLRALMAEKVFKLDHDIKVSCPTCANKGMLGVQQPGGNDAPQRCPTCRGSGVLYRIIYH